MPGRGRWSAFFQRTIIDHLLRGVPFTPSRSIYMGLFLVNPHEGSEDGVEVVGADYERQVLKLTLPAKGRTENPDDVVFPRASLDWGVLKGVGVWNAEQAGDLVFWTELDEEREIRQADTFRMPAGEFSIIVN